MIDMLNCFQEEVLRVICDVGIEGKLGGHAQAGLGFQGIWKDLTDNVNTMATNLTLQVRAVAQVTTAVANGDLSKNMTAEAKGEFLELKNTINTMVDQLNAFASEVTRVAREVGTEGKLGGQAQVTGKHKRCTSGLGTLTTGIYIVLIHVGVGGTWKDLTHNVNTMAANLTGQVRAIALVTTAVANGDLSKKITAEAQVRFCEALLSTGEANCM